MKKSLAFISIVFGIFACVLVFIKYFKTPPLAITIFSILGVISGVIGMKDQKVGGVIGTVLSALAFIYLMILFIGLGS